MASLKDSLYQYFAQSHFNAMPNDQMARFKDYITTKDYQGHMRWWKSEFMNNDNTLRDVPDFTKDGKYKFDDANWKQLYSWFQQALQGMYTDMQDGVFAHDTVMESFIKKWFGPGKIFQSTTANDDTNRAFSALADFLERNSSLEPYFNKNIQNVFDGNLTYSTFIKKLKSKEYDKDLKFRNKVNSVINYMRQYGPTKGYEVPNPANWPAKVGYTEKETGYGTLIVGELNSPLKEYFDTTNPKSWVNVQDEEHFELKGETVLREAFEQNHKELLDTLLNSGKIRNSFEKYDQGTGSKISSQLKKALEETAYDNKDSKDYVIPKQTDERNFLDRIKKIKDDTYENHFKKFFEPRYGSRMYYSPYAQNIAKVFDKLGIKPTDGIDGILAKKDNILKEINKTVAGKSTSHFNWFIKTMEKIKTSIPKAYADALRNPHQMLDVVSHLIVEAINSDPQNIAEAKTAMELLAVTRYGIMTSRTRNALNEGLKDAKLFSDDKLSWNKNEGVKIVAGAIDSTIKAGIKLGALAGTSIYNLIRNNRKRKFGNDISDNKDLAAAYSKWAKKDEENMTNEIRAAENNLKLLEKGLGRSGEKISKDTVDNLRKKLADLETPGKSPEDINKLNDLKGDIETYNKLMVYKMGSAEDKQEQWRKEKRNTDHFHELIRYWDMLDNFTKTHSFNFGSMKLKRDAFLRGFGEKDKSDPDELSSMAEKVARDFAKELQVIKYSRD